LLTTSSEEACVDFYTRVLGRLLETFTPQGSAPRKAFTFGIPNINLHVKGADFEPKAKLPTTGALDLCFMAPVPLNNVMEKLAQEHWPIEAGPVLRTGATQKIRSIYIRDTDQNLIEISEPA
jgi:catechol 2,3-dioxygenase-like lactoylglutathione lyase family enzyme